MMNTIQIDDDEVPRVPLFQPTIDGAMREDVIREHDGFHSQPTNPQRHKA